jgi:AcrR family transcriptional regulator
VVWERGGQVSNRQHPEGDAARAGLSRDRIVRAAVELIEREGEDALSMRALAAELGVAVMSLYNHVRSKAALLDGIAEYIIGGMSVIDHPEAHWTERARALVRAYRKVAHDFPRSVTIVLTRRINPPVGLRPVEHALAISDDAGFDGETSVRIMRALLAYAMGAQMREVGAAKTLDYLPDDPARQLRELDAERFPHVVALHPALLRHDAETDFEFGLDLLITALDSLPRRS